MAALLEQHNDFIFVPSGDSLDAELARMFVEARSCAAWRGGIFSTDGSTSTCLRSCLAIVRHSMTENPDTH